jgi:hypothetical protein
MEPEVAEPPPRLGGSVRDKFRTLVQWAVLAPSSHNTQPWLFRMRGDALELCADTGRALPNVDPERRELVMSCGAALYHVRLAMRYYGHVPAVELLPDPSDPILLARIRIGARLLPTREEVLLFEAIPRRHTYRGPFAPQELSFTVLQALERAAAVEGATIRLVTDPDEKHAVADLVATGDRRQAGRRAVRREIAAWMQANESRRNDGIPGYALGMGGLASRIAPFVVRNFDWGSSRAESDFDLAVGSPALLVLSTRGNDVRAWMRAGAAVARMLLRANVDGVSASFLNQPIEESGLRLVLADLLDIAGEPQLLLRVGYGAAGKATPRRPVDEVMAPY